MPTVAVSPKYQVVIPKVIRESLKLRGFVKGINTEFKLNHADTVLEGQP